MWKITYVQKPDFRPDYYCNKGIEQLLLICLRLIFFKNLPVKELAQVVSVFITRKRCRNYCFAINDLEAFIEDNSESLSNTYIQTTFSKYGSIGNGFDKTSGLNQL